MTLVQQALLVPVLPKGSRSSPSVAVGRRVSAFVMAESICTIPSVLLSPRGLRLSPPPRLQKWPIPSIKMPRALLLERNGTSLHPLVPLLVLMTLPALFTRNRAPFLATSRWAIPLLRVLLALPSTLTLPYPRIQVTVRTTLGAPSIPVPLDRQLCRYSSLLSALRKLVLVTPYRHRKLQFGHRTRGR